MTPVRVTLLGDSLVADFDLSGAYGCDGLRGTLRPYTVGELDAHRQRVAAAPKDRHHRLECEHIAASLRSWNFGDETGGVHPLTADTVAKLPEFVFDALAAAVAGRVGVQLVGKSDSPSGSPPTTPAG